MDNFIKSVDTPDEAIDVFKQLQPLLLKHGFELKKCITKSNDVTEEILEDLRSTSDTRQVKVEPSMVGSAVLGLRWNFTEDISQVCRSTSNEAENPITQRKIFSLVSSVSDPLGLFAPFSVHIRLILKRNWTKIGHFWGHLSGT